MSDYMEQRAEIVEDYCVTCGYKDCRCNDPLFSGRYDRESDIQRALHHAFQLQQACRAVGHVNSKLDYDAVRNVLTCENCKYEMDLNPLVDERLRVGRVA